jgi:hypothetical protein
MTGMTLCESSQCGVPHEDLLTVVDDALVGKVYSTTPRDEARGHESLLIGRTDSEVTVSCEFGDARATVVIPVATFDQLVARTKETR